MEMQEKLLTGSEGTDELSNIVQNSPSRSFQLSGGMIESIRGEILDSGSVSSKQFKELMSHKLIRNDVLREIH